MLSPARRPCAPLSSYTPSPSISAPAPIFLPSPPIITHASFACSLPVFSSPPSACPLPFLVCLTLTSRLSDPHHPVCQSPPFPPLHLPDPYASALPVPSHLLGQLALRVLFACHVSSIQPVALPLTPSGLPVLHTPQPACPFPFPLSTLTPLIHASPATCRVFTRLFHTL